MLFTNAFAAMRYRPNQKTKTTALVINPMIHTGTSVLSAYPATNLGMSVRVEPLLDDINGDLTPLYYKLVMFATSRKNRSRLPFADRSTCSAAAAPLKSMVS